MTAASLLARQPKRSRLPVQPIGVLYATSQNLANQLTFRSHPFMSCSGSGWSLRATAAVLLLAYLGLAGEAIHCQYFPAAHSDHTGHSTAPVPTANHSIHCLVANHAGSIAIDTNGSAPLPALSSTFRVLPDEGPSLVGEDVRLRPARAPPLV